MYQISTKQKIYETAKRLFIDEGYRVGSRKIAECAEVNQGLITYYFKSKKNIALMVLKEIYEIVGIHLKYQVDPDEDILLYILTFLRVIAQNISDSENFARFIGQVSSENLLEESILYANNQTRNYTKLVETLMPENENPLEQNMQIFIGLVFGVERNLRIQRQTDASFTEEALFEWQLRAFIWGLRLDWPEDQIQALKRQVNDGAKKLMVHYPVLYRPEVYLFQELKYQEA